MSRFAQLGRFWALAVLVAGAGLPLSQDALAEETAIEEILVTAQKREEALTDVPLSIQVADGEFLDRNNVKNLRELVNFVPGAATGEAFGSDQTRIQLRGIPQIAGDPTIGYYLGDTPFYFPSMLWAPVVRTSGLERIEIVKGPQSTLYGGGAMGGVLRIIPKKPNLQEFEASVNLGYMDYGSEGDDGWSVDASFSLPLIEDKLAARVSFAEEEGPAWIDVQPHAINFATFTFDPSGPLVEDVGGTDITDLRVQVLATPTDNLTLEFMYAGNESQTAPTGFLLIDSDDISADSDPNYTSDDTEYDVYSATITYDFESFSVTSTVSQLEFSEDWRSGLISDFGFPIYVFYDPETFSNETRITSHFDGRFNFVAGVYYVDSERSQIIELESIGFVGTADAESEQISVFGEFTYELVEDELTLLIGGRWFEDDREFVETQTFGAFGFALPSFDETFDNVNPRVNLSWTPDDDSLYYINVAKGFRSGLFNGVSSCNTIMPTTPELADLRNACLNTPTIDPDELWSYEIGTKLTLADGTLLLDASIYYQDWTDVQGAARAGSVSTSAQLGDADGFGVDLGLVWAPESVPGLNVSLAASYIDVEMSKLDPIVAAGFGAYYGEGDGIPGTPDFSGALSINYGWQISGNIAGDLTVSLNHKSDHIASMGSTRDAEERTYLNMRFGLLIGENWGVSIFGDNLTNEDATQFIQAGPFYQASIKTIEAPRLLGVEISYDL